MALAAGARLGPYEIRSAIAAGGMGEVYRAYDIRLQRTVAIKILRRDKLVDERLKKRFLTEARAASILKHPNIVVIYDISSEADLDFLVMEYLSGESLDQVLKKGRLPVGAVARYGAQIASALASAHEAGVVHRDIKPANIMVTADSQIKVLDFGLAKLDQPSQISADGETETLERLTQPGLLMGTVAYMSPEQIKGEPLDWRSDMFSLGCVLYEALTGRIPFPGSSTLAIMQAITSLDPPPPSQLSGDVPPQFDQVVLRALRKNKIERYASANEFVEVLRAFESGEVGATVPVLASSPSKKMYWWLTAALIGGLLAGGALYHWTVGKKHTLDPQAAQLYLKGREDIQEFTEHGFKQSLVDFGNAIKRDPDYAAAYAGLADAYSYLGAFELASPKDVMPLAESNAAKALEKDPQTAEAYTSLGIVALAYYWDFPLAEQRFQRSLKLNSRDAFTHHYLGHYYESRGRWQDALRQMQLALSLDKLSPIYGEDTGSDLLAIRKAGDAVKQLRETVALAPEDPFARVLLAIALEATGNPGESLEEAAQAVKLPGIYSVAGTAAGVFNRLGHRGQAEDLLRRLEAARASGDYVAPLEFAMVRFALGDKRQGLANMHEALRERSFNIVYDIPDPVFDVVREDAEFASMMEEMHVPRACWHEVPRYVK